MPQSHVRGELVFRRIEPAQDLRGALGEQSPRIGQPDTASGALDELGPRFRLEPGEVMADRRLGVVEFPRSTSHRTVPGYRGEHPEPRHVQHDPSIDVFDSSPYASIDVLI